MLFLWYPKCTTCQKAKAFLDERGVSYEARDIKLENPTAEELRGWWEKSGMPLKKFFNTSGLQYKALGLKDKLPEMSEEEQLALLATDGMLVKRPILVGEDFVRTGFRQAEWETALGCSSGTTSPRWMVSPRWCSGRCTTGCSAAQTGISSRFSPLRISIS